MVLSPSGAASAAPDGWLTTTVKFALLTADDVASTANNVDAIGGHVTLQGTVRTAGEQEKAAAVAAAVDGVHQVRNPLVVEVPKQDLVADRVDDDVIANWDIAVEVSGGVVRLTGTVPSQSDRRQALSLARDDWGAVGRRPTAGRRQLTRGGARRHQHLGLVRGRSARPARIGMTPSASRVHRAPAPTG